MVRCCTKGSDALPLEYNHQPSEKWCYRAKEKPVSVMLGSHLSPVASVMLRSHLSSVVVTCNSLVRCLWISCVKCMDPDWLCACAAIEATVYCYKYMVHTVSTWCSVCQVCICDRRRSMQQFQWRHVVHSAGSDGHPLRASATWCFCNHFVCSYTCCQYLNSLLKPSPPQLKIPLKWHCAFHHVPSWLATRGCRKLKLCTQIPHGNCH